MSLVEVYTDGACSKNGSDDAVGGIGVWFGPQHAKNVSEPIHGHCSSHRAELEAVIRAMILTLDDQNVLIHCDNLNVVNGLKNHDLQTYAEEGWLTDTMADPICWQKIWILQSTRQCFKRPFVQIEHVKAHAKSVGNNEADKLAVLGRESAKMMR